mmetsp:Transcript_22939/g.26158  ORF Transcript_22939/g.26158 Transcript_22939/m.26158 type:complete len:329 (+) Transcript_22939:105-1091(+)
MDQEATIGPRCENEEKLSLLSEMLNEERTSQKALDYVALSHKGSGSTCPIWRERVGKWYYDVIDHLGEGRSTVYVAMNILDRYFVAKKITDASDRNYEVSSLTALFLALRIRGSECLGVLDLIRMSRLGVTIKEIVEVGKDMTGLLTFERRLLTPSDFVLQMLHQMQGTRAHDIRNSSLHYAELSVLDGEIAGMKASEIAIASILNALGLDTTHFVSKMINLSGVKCFSNDLQDLRTRLKTLKEKHIRMNQPHVILDSDDEDNNDLPYITIPVCVASKKIRGMKRSNSCARLHSIDMINLSTEMPTVISDSRPVSPIPKQSKKFRRSD